GALNWSKPARSKGDLTLTATLGGGATVNSLSLNAAGLRASGKISLKPGGGLDRAEFDRVRLDGWLDTAVRVGGRGRGAPPAITVSGGTLDFRRAGLGSAGGGAGAARGPITIALDRLVLTEGIALTGFKGTLAAGRGIDGSFTARVNGGTPLRVELA